MAKLLSKAITALIIIPLLLSICTLDTQQFPTAHASTPTLYITNIRTVNSDNQNCFYFCRGANIAVFDVSVQNNITSVASGQLIITMTDVGRVPVESFESNVFSVNAGQNETIQVARSIIPTYAFVGIASAQVILENPSTGPIGFGNINYYIGYTIPPSYEFSGITLSPSYASVIAGNSVNFTAIAHDNLGNYLDISLGSNWNINSRAEGSWLENTYSAARAGIWNVTASLGSYSAAAMISVAHGATAAIVLSPQKTSVTAGQSQTFSATANDAYGNSWDVTASAVFSINSLASGSWAGNVYTSAKAGTWTVTGGLGSLIGQASFTVVHGPINSLAISPQSANLTAGSSLVFIGTAFDSYENSWDVTASTVFSTSSDAGGSWSGNTYTAATAGVWVVSGSFSGFTKTASLTVSHGSPITISVAMPSDVNSGCSFTFSSTAYDAYNNGWNVTSLTSWSISSGAGGSWSGNTYTSANLGNWVITANYLNIKDNADLGVYYPIDFYFAGTVNFLDIIYFIGAYTNFYENGIFNPACDLNHDGSLNYMDLNLLVAYYTAYSQG